MPKISNFKRFGTLVIGILNLFGIWILGFGFLLPAGSQAAWSEPSQAPTGGNAAVPVYSEGIGQILNGTLKVDPAATNNNPLIVGNPQLPLPVGNTSIIAAGTLSGIQGESVGNALFGNLTANGAGGGRSVYGLAVDAGDYALYGGGGLGLGLASGDIWFLQQDQGLAWPRESDGALSYGVYVSPAGELQVRGKGAGINLMDQNAASRLTISEAGVVNVAAGGSLTVNTTPVCLQSGIGCPSAVIPTLQQVTTSGNTSSNQIRLTPSNVEALRVITDPGFSPLVLRNNADTVDLFRVNQGGDGSFAGNLTVSGSSVCRQNGTNCPPPPAPPTQYWVPVGGTNDIDSTNSGAVRIKHDLLYDSFNSAQNTIDFDPWQGNLGNYFLIRSGWNPSYGEKWHLRVNRTGETLLGNNLFIGTGGGVASMTPYNDPTVNASWKIGRVGGTNTIEATPGGGVGSVGDINLKSGTLKLRWLNSDAGDVMLNDTLDVQYGIINSTATNAGRVYVNDELNVQNNFLAQTKAAFGGYAIDPFFTVTTPSLWSDQGRFTKVVVGNPTGSFLTGSPPPPQQTGGFVNAEKLCIQGDCKGAWPADAGSATGWTRINPHVYLTTGTDRVGIGTQVPTSKLQVNAVSGEEGVRIISSNFSPFIIRNSSNTADLARIDQSGQLTINGPWNKIGGATSNRALAVKTDANGLGLGVECGVAGCNNILSINVTNDTYTVFRTYNNTSGAMTNLALQPNAGALNGGNVGIGTNTPSARLQIEPLGNMEGLRVISGSWSPFIIRNAADNADLFRVDQSGNGTLLGSLKIGATNFTFVNEAYNGATGLSLKGPDNVTIMQFGVDPILGGFKNIVMQKNLYFDHGVGSPDAAIMNNGGVVSANFNTFSGSNFCLGGNCKVTDWGPLRAAYPAQPPYAPAGQLLPIANVREYITMSASFDNSDYFCSPGFVVIGFRNSSPGQLICGKMW